MESSKGVYEWKKIGEIEKGSECSKCGRYGHSNIIKNVYTGEKKNQCPFCGHEY